eukprot:SAG31_NODE_116_length_24094_cov_38.884184_23_plen_223_part_00
MDLPTCSSAAVRPSDSWAECQRSASSDHPDACFDDTDSLSSVASDGSDAVSGVEDPSGDEIVTCSKKRKSDAHGAPRRKTMRRTVSFSNQCVTRTTDTAVVESSESEKMRKAAPIVDTQDTVKSEDGPKPSSQLLDDLVISFFERGTINGPEDLRTLMVANAAFRAEVSCVAKRCACLLKQLRRTCSALVANASPLHFQSDSRKWFCGLTARAVVLDFYLPM